MVIRKANPDDANALCRIYNHYVVHTAVTFETDPVSEAEMGQRILEVQNENLPYFVLEVEVEWWATIMFINGKTDVRIRQPKR